MIIGVLIVFFPIWLAFVASTVTQQEIAQARRCRCWPGDQFIENYTRALVSGVNVPVATMLINSLIMAMGIAIGKIIISLLSAFAIVYFRFPRRKYVLLADLPHADAAGRGADRADLRGRGGLWHAQQLFRADLPADRLGDGHLPVPAVLHDRAGRAGRGGARRWRRPMRFFIDILLPMSRTNIAALFVILFIYGWNQYLWPLLITTDPSMNTIVMGLKQMFPSGDDLADWPVIMATSILAMIPPVIVVIGMQKLFIRGLVDSEK
jgi:sn-glycerol 3-phosphate transport system permease protein